MTNRALMEEIESGPVRADLGLASTRHALLQRLEAHPVVGAARRRIAEDPANADLFLDRAIRLFETRGPQDYAHPDDLALSAYLYILARDPLPQVQGFISRVARAKRPEFYAATSVAQYVAARMPTTTVAETARPLPVLRGLREQERTWSTGNRFSGETAVVPGTTVSGGARRGRRTVTIG